MMGLTVRGMRYSFVPRLNMAKIYASLIDLIDLIHCLRGAAAEAAL